MRHSIAQECRTGRFGSEHAGPALDVKFTGDPASACDEPDDRFGKVDVEAVASLPRCGYSRLGAETWLSCNPGVTNPG
jgi:hypothetical protein